MGILECDDGNLAMGDGCDLFCMVEDGFACQGGDFDLSDLCVDVLPPQAAISFVDLDNYIMLVTFSEQIQSISIYIYTIGSMKIC